MQEAVAVTEQALGRDPWHTELLEMHVGLLHQTGSKDRLLTLSHRLAKELPGRCITWLCIATFYLVRESRLAMWLTRMRGTRERGASDPSRRSQALVLPP